MVAFQAEASPTLLDSLGGPNAAELRVLAVGGVRHLLTVLAVFLVANGETDPGYFVGGAVDNVTDSFAGFSEEHHVIKQGLVDWLVGQVLYLWKVLDVLWGLVTRPFAPAETHVEADYAPVEESFLFAVLVPVFGPCLLVVDHLLGHGILSVGHAFSLFVFLEEFLDFLVALAGFWVSHGTVFPLAHAFYKGGRGFEVLVYRGFLDRCAVVGIAARERLGVEPEYFVLCCKRKFV
jgi:hypothetical protein